MATQMLQRRGTAIQWANANPILGAGEIGFETDTKIVKLGDGVTPWNSLSSGYVSKRGGDVIQASGATVTPLVLRGAAGQTADIWRAETSDGEFVRVSNTGEIFKGNSRLATIAEVMSGYMAKGEKASDSELLDGINSTAFALLAGSTFTGEVDAKFGLDVRQSGTTKAASDIPSTYPTGISSYSVTTASGWPAAGVVINEVLPGSTYSIQLFIPAATGQPIQYRTRTSNATDTWTAWTAMLLSTGKAADSSLLDGNAASAFATSGHSHTFPVTSVNGRTGAVSGLAESSHTHAYASDTHSHSYPVTSVNGRTGAVTGLSESHSHPYAASSHSHVVGQASNVRGGRTTVTTAGDAVAVIAHGLGTTPAGYSGCVGNNTGGEARTCNPDVSRNAAGADATNLYFKIARHDGVAIANTSVLVAWMAFA